MQKSVFSSVGKYDNNDDQTLMRAAILGRYMVIGMSDPSGSGVPPSPTPDVSPASSPTRRSPRQREMLFAQYKLAVEMAAHSSTKRQEANRFYIGLITSFGVLYSLMEKLPESATRTLWKNVLPLAAVAWCGVWWFTIRSYRRINKAKWHAIYELEKHLPGKPFRLEQAFLSGQTESEHVAGSKGDTPGSFALSSLELLMPILVGLVFLFLAALPLLMS